MHVTQLRAPTRLIVTIRRAIDAELRNLETAGQSLRDNSPANPTTPEISRIVAIAEAVYCCHLEVW